jgi:hypothetical protein
MKAGICFVSVCLLLSFTACKKQPDGQTKEAIGLVHGGLGQILTVQGEEELVLDILEAKQKEGTQYEIGVDDSLGNVEKRLFTLNVVGDLTEFIAQIDTMVSYPLQIVYKNARCGNPHMGFNAPCMATFGAHQNFGNSMTWSVDPWQSCMNGDTICVEKWKKVGLITYYQSQNCSDTLTITRPIRKFRCDLN